MYPSLKRLVVFSIQNSSFSAISPNAFTAQREGGPIEEIHPGDVISIPSGEKHWHGGTPTTAMTHIAIQEALDGKVVDWLEMVSDDQYRK